MSKFVKDQLTNHLKSRLDGVQDLLLVDVVGLDAVRATALRRQLRDKNISLLVVKNSLARRATEGTKLVPAFEGSAGSLALVWGSTDIVALAKEIVRLQKEKDYEKLAARGGVMDGAALGAEQVVEVSKWPSREEQLSILAGQILSPGARLVSQLLSAGGALASQIKQRGEGADEEAAPSGSTDGNTDGNTNASTDSGAAPASASGDQGAEAAPSTE